MRRLALALVFAVLIATPALSTAPTRPTADLPAPPAEATRAAETAPADPAPTTGLDLTRIFAASFGRVGADTGHRMASAAETAVSPHAD